MHYITSYTLHYITLNFIALHELTLHGKILHNTTPHHIALHYITLCYITLSYVTLCYVTLSYVTLRYITLHSFHHKSYNRILMATNRQNSDLTNKFGDMYGRCIYGWWGLNQLFQFGDPPNDRWFLNPCNRCCSWFKIHPW